MRRLLIGAALGVAIGLPTALPPSHVSAAIEQSPIVAMPATCLSTCHLDEDGIAFIQAQEGFSLVPYRDSAGIWTVGTGHRILPSDRIVYPLVGQAAADMLKHDVAVSETGLNRAVKVPLVQHEFNPLCSLAFNEGIGAIGGSTLVRVLNIGDRPGAAARFLDWNKITIGGRKVPDKGLTLRRRREQALFLLGQ